MPVHRFGRKEAPFSGVVSAVFFLVLYLFCAGSTKPEEVLAGSIVAAGSSLLLHHIRKRRRTPMVFTSRWLKPFPRLVPAVFLETALLISVLAKAAVGKKREGGFINYRTNLKGNDPQSSALRAIAAYGVCFSPNSYLVAFTGAEILMHQLVGRRLAKSDRVFLRLK